MEGDGVWSGGGGGGVGHTHPIKVSITYLWQSVMDGLAYSFNISIYQLRINLSPSLSILVSGEIEGQLSEKKDVERNIRNMQNDMLKLNQLLTKEGKLQENLQQDNILIETDFVLSLKVFKVLLDR